jgi:glycosyltransferase involved in cell wall biosynthesis
MQIPVLTSAVLQRGRHIHKASGRSVELPAELETVFRSVFAGGETLDGLARRAGRPAESLRTALQETDSLAFVPCPELEADWDLVMVDQGATGVFVQTLEIWRTLNRTRRVLLISQEPPPFPDGELERSPDLRGRLLTLKTLVDRGLPRSYLSYYHYLRTLLKQVRADLLLFSFRREATFFFDLIHHRPSLIYSDFYHERQFALARNLFGQGPPGEETVQRLLEHLFFNIHQQFQHSTPANDLTRLEADWIALCGARANWCWSATEADRMAGASGLDTIDFVGPAIDLERLDRAGGTERQRRVLFISTMPNFHRKGLVPLCQIVSRLPEDTKLTLVSRVDLEPYFLERDPRIELRRNIDKDEVIRLYHQSLCYVRVAEEDTLPYSLTEAMACRLPAIVSPEIQANFPGIEDGVTGFVVRPDDPETLAEKLNILLADEALRRRMGEACRERVLRFAMDRQLGRLEGLLGGAGQST